jgi:hypothetical protein
MSFLPDNYSVPVGGGNYMKLLDGENTFRVLGSAIIGWEYWTDENKPVRLKERPNKTPSDIRTDKDGKPSKIKHFWAFPVYNHTDKKIQVFEITQATIQSAIKALVDNQKWGNPRNYDISITRKGEGFDTTYTVMPNPHSALEGDVEKEYQGMDINLEVLFDGGDPFGGKDDVKIDSPFD